MRWPSIPSQFPERADSGAEVIFRRKTRVSEWNERWSEVDRVEKWGGGLEGLEEEEVETMERP